MRVKKGREWVEQGEAKQEGYWKRGEALHYPPVAEEVMWISPWQRGLSPRGQSSSIEVRYGTKG